MTELKSMQIKINSKGYFTLDLKNYEKVDKFVIKDIDYLADKIMLKSKDKIDTKKSFFNSKNVHKLIEALYIRSLAKLNKKANIKDIEDVERRIKIKHFIFITDDYILTPITIVISKSKTTEKVKLELSFRNVNLNLYHCKSNESCRFRKEAELYPYDICCCGCELSKTCNLVCNQRKGICFDKEEY